MSDPAAGWRRCLVSFLLAFFVLAGPAMAADDLAALRAKGQVTIAVKADYPPWGFRDPQGRLIGMEIDLAQDIARRIGVPAQIVAVQSANRLEVLRQNQADIVIATMGDNASRRRIIGMVEPHYYASGINLLAREELGRLPDFFEVKRYRVTIERRKNKYDRMVSLSEAVVVVRIDGEKKLSVSDSLDNEGHDRGPVNALAKALAKDLGPYQAVIDDMRLVDFKVRITQGGTEAVTRVIIDSQDGAGRRWQTVGVSANIVDASFEALLDAVRWKLIRDCGEAGKA